MQFDIQDPQGELWYEPGDHAVVYPANSDEDVDFLLSCTTDVPVDATSIVQLESFDKGSGIYHPGFFLTETNLIETYSISGWQSAVTDLTATTIKDAFKYHISLKHVPSKELLTFLSSKAANPQEAAELKCLGNDEKAYEIWTEKCLNFLDVFRAYPSLRAESAELAYRLPSLQPRFYSIASKPERLDINGTCHLMMDLILSVVEFKVDQDGSKVVKGFCSNFLANLQAGDSVPLFLSSNPSFHWKGGNAPTLLIGAGSGIAPFRGFWQAEAAKRLELSADSLINNNANQITLFFGCRNQRDNILANETSNLGHIMQRINAFSRIGRKQYVQDALRADSNRIIQTILDGQGTIYVCGFKELADSVHDALADIIDEHAHSRGTGEMYLDLMEKEGRYIKEVFGSKTARKTKKDDGRRRRTSNFGA